MANDTILLIGPRGSGKSTVGRQLAELIGYAFVDLDDRVLTTFGEPTVSDVWAAHGEQAWRRAEDEVFALVMQDPEQVIALGGGAPMIEPIQQRIRRGQAAGLVMTIYLTSPVPVLARRLADDAGDRPSLTGGDLVEEIPDVLAVRRATYEALADMTCDTSEGDPEEIAAALAEALAPEP